MSPAEIENLRNLEQRPRLLGHPIQMVKVLKTFSILWYLIKINTCMCDKTCYTFIEDRVYWNCLSDKICISYTNVYSIYNCIQNFE